MIIAKAHGKINLTLDVLKLLDNGYHQVKMIMQQIQLHDEIIITKENKDHIKISSDMTGVPLGERNLAYKAAAVMMDKYSLNTGIAIHLQKKLPMEAGLAGGSSNAAAVLMGINQLFQLNCSQEELMELGGSLGADVPFCILGGTALAEGIGEQLTPIVNNTKLDLILVKPPMGVSTKQVYSNLAVDKITSRPDTEAMISALAKGHEQMVASLLGNVLEEVTVKLYPEIDSIKRQLAQWGISSLMCGSGSTVFGIIPKSAPQMAAKAYEYFQQKEGYQVFLTTTI